MELQPPASFLNSYISMYILRYEKCYQMFERYFVAFLHHNLLCFISSILLYGFCTKTDVRFFVVFLDYHKHILECQTGL